VHDVNHADKRGGPKRHGCGSTKNFDAFDVVEIQRRQRRIECAAQRNIVDDEEKRVELLQAPHFGNCARRTVVAARRDVKSRGERQCVAEGGHTSIAQILPADHVKRERHVVSVLGDPRRHDLNVLAELRRHRCTLALGQRRLRRDGEKKDQPALPARG
jgi:hypothetical protein